MSIRRKPGEVVKRKPGSGFVGSAEPFLVKIPDGKAFEYDTVKDTSRHPPIWRVNPGGEASWCTLGCGDDECKEYANLEIASGPNIGEFLFHISECELEDYD